MRKLALIPFGVMAFAMACADSEVTAPRKAAAGRPSFTLSPTPERTFVYVANTSSNNVSVIRTSDNAVVATIAVGENPRGVGITPTGGRVYVANRSSDNVSVIRTSDNTVIATIPVGQDPQDVAVAPDGGRVYVLNATDGSISVVRTSDNTVVATIDVGDVASTMAITPDGSELFVNRGVNSDGGVLGTVTTHYTSAIRTSDYSVRASITWFLKSAIDVAILHDGTRAYLPNFGGLPPSGSLRVIRTGDLGDLASLSLSGLFSPGKVSITPNDAYAYLVDPGMANFNGGCSPGGVQIIPTSTNTIETTVSVSCFPSDIVFSLDGALAYVSNTAPDRTGNVTLISTSQKAVVGSVPVGTAPTGLAIGFVPTPSQLMDELEDDVRSLELADGFEGSLLTKLTSALNAIQTGKTRAACGALQDFVSQVMAQSGKKIAAADATLLINLASQVRELIGC